MQHKTTRTLFGYWNDLRGDRIAPRRFEIEPARIGDILPDTFILERIDRKTYPFRLAGTRISDLFSADLRGSNFVSGWGPDDGPEIERKFDQLASQGGVGLLTMVVATPEVPAVLLEVVVLPLIHQHLSADRFLGSIVRLDTTPPHHSPSEAGKRLVRAEIIWPDGRPHAILDAADRQAPFMPHIRTARIVRQDRRQFRVYDGGLSTGTGATTGPEKT